MEQKPILNTSKAILNTSIEPTYTVADENHSFFKNGKDVKLIKKFLKSHYVFRYNDLLSKIEFKKTGFDSFMDLTDYEENSILNKMAEKEIKCSNGMLRQILHSDNTPKYHPFKDYFKQLPKWDRKTDYIQQLSQTVKTHNQELWKLCLRRWLIAVTASATNDDIINHCMIVLQGKQGIGKSRWFRSILPMGLKDYSYNGSLQANNKDNAVLLQECLIINLEELEDIKKSSALKDIITKESTKIRRPYGRNNEKIIQYASFVASINKKQFLVDKTGNRRFLCFEVLERTNENHKIDMDLVYSQAYFLFQNGEKYWFDDEIALIEANNKNFAESNSLESIIGLHFEPTSKNVSGSSFYTSTEFINYLKEEKLFSDEVNNVEMGKTLVKLGFERIKGKDSCIGYYIRKITHSVE